uniref:Uncharacterized protein n=1 Tax=Triticum urartu TaxID=4572 RepID=A0A8R7PUQ5_TRIUA
MAPESALEEKSNSSILNNFPSESGIDPSNKFLDRFRLIIICSAPNEVGISPDSWLLDRSISVIAVSFPTSSGREPLKEFCDKSSSISFRWRHRLVGMVEDNELRDSVIICIWLRLLMLLGMGPTSLLLSRCNLARLVNPLISAGMVPDKLLLARLSSWRLLIAAIGVGIVPFSWFPLSDRVIKLVRLANVPGMLPVILLLSAIKVSRTVLRFPM